MIKPIMNVTSLFILGGSLIGLWISLWFIAIVKENRSMQSKLIEMILRLSKVNQSFQRTKVDAYLDRCRQITIHPYVFPERMRLGVDVDQVMIDDMQVYFLGGRARNGQRHIFYLHGGAYVNQPTILHWMFLSRFLKRLNASAVLPIYPKAPGHQYEEAFSKVLRLYEDTISQIEAGNVIIMGDSSGGGFALALAQLLKEKGLPQPGHIVMMSPWLDISMENPEIRQYESMDPILGVDGLIKIGMTWAGSQDPHSYLLSPINGELKGLGAISLIVGTHEIFLPDARKLREIAVKQGVKINYFEHDKMNHVFPLFPIPEAKLAQHQIIDIIENDQFDTIFS